jgi:MFS family permease
MSQKYSSKIGEKSFFNIRNFPFYYGWIILIVGSIGVLASIPGQTMGVSVFTDFYINNLNISRVEIATAYMVGTLASSFLIPHAGLYFDRFGARIVAAVATVFLSLFLLILGFSPSIIAFILSIFNAPHLVVVFIVMTIGFFGIRFFGQGVLTLVCKGMVAKWFGSRRGFAVGIMGLITAFGFSFAPQPLHAMIQKFQWNRALIVIALFLTVVFLPIVIIFFRAEPGKYGIELEHGMKEKVAKNKNLAMDSKIDKTVQQARKEPVYWVIILSLGYWGLFNTAFTFNIISIFGEIGIDATQALKIFLPISIISVISRFAGSYLSDRISIKYIYITYIVSLIFCAISLMFIKLPIARIMLIFSFGISGGLFGMLNIVTWPKLYGRLHFGAISGAAMSMVVAGSAIGPWLFSLMKKYTGSYHIAGLFGIIITSIFLILVLKVDWTVDAK